uniref:Peroxisomal 2,4-dienoyl-CoA reductase [(3E)-enoyl-CoA-producing] n=1 Tax=Chelonoidis abingdonii TaxID=106734 RepID=A0A8C0GRB1_CHEAB
MPPPDVDTDDCLQDYSYLFSPDILKAKVAFITGGGSGIGFRVAEVFMRHGCRTIIASRNLQRVAEVSRWESGGRGAGKSKTIFAYFQRDQNTIGAVRHGEPNELHPLLSPCTS